MLTVLSPLDSLILNEGVVYGVLFILDDRASAIAYYPDADFQTHISVLVHVTGFEPSITSIKSRVPYLSATRAYYGGKPRYRPEHPGVADPRLSFLASLPFVWWNALDLNQDQLGYEPRALTYWTNVPYLAPKERLELPHAHT